MKKQKLIFAVLALLVGGANSASAYSISDLTSAGWTQVTDLSSMNLSDYYFAIVSNDNTDLMVKMDKAKSGQQASNHSMWYMNGKDPIKDNSYLWTLEANNTSGYVGYTIRNVDRPVRVLQTHNGEPWFCRTNWETTSARWTSYDFEVSEGIYSIKALANGGTNYLGLWTYNNGYVSGQELAGNKSGDQIGKFKIYSISKTTANSRIAEAAEATSSSPSDLAPSLWGRTTADYTSDVSLGYYGDYRYLERYRDNVAPQTGDIITKTITNAPNGIHNISVIVNAAWISGRGSVGTTVPTVNDNSTVVTINGVSKNVPVRTDGSYDPVTLNFTTRVTDGKIDFAIHNNDAAAFWFVWDITDIFHNTSLSEDAIALPANGDMDADTWYYIDIAATADNYNATATALDDIVYTTDGTILSRYSSSVTAKFTAENNSLSQTRYYVKSSSNNNLQIAPAAYTYSISSAVSDIAYIQEGNTVTISYTTSTNDPDGSLTQNYSGVTLNGSAISCTPTTKGFTFTVPAVTANTDYTLAIPAGAIKYNEDNKNAAQNITLKTPALFDGTYFISDGTKYISRGGESNTEAILDEYGIAVEITTDAENVSLVKFVDANLYLYAGQNSVYTDKTIAAGGENVKWTIAAYSDGYSFLTGRDRSSELNPGNYIVAGDGYESSKEAATYDESAYAWKLEDPATHAAIMATYKDANAEEVATAAGLSATTVTELKTIIEGAGWVSENVAVTDAIASIQEKYQFGNSETPISENLTGLEDGIYKVKLSVFKRIAGNADTYNLYNNNQDSPTAYLFAGDNKAQVPSVMSEYSNEAYTGGSNPVPDYAIDGKHYPNNLNAAGGAFNAGRYTLEVFAYVDGGSLNIGLKNPAKYANSNWLCYRDLVVTRYYPGVSKTIDATLGWATYCSPYALDFSSDIANLTGAYLVTGGADGKLTLSDKISGTIPANTGILLEGSGEVNIPVVASSETNVSSNKLVGVTTETADVAAGIYVLLYGVDDTSGPVGFYKTAKAFTIGANTAYLPAGFDSDLAREAYFFDGLTGVEAVEAASKAVAKEGKFIVDGKLRIFSKGKMFNANGQLVK